MLCRMWVTCFQGLAVVITLAANDAASWATIIITVIVVFFWGQMMLLLQECHRTCYPLGLVLWMMHWTYQTIHALWSGTTYRCGSLSTFPEQEAFMGDSTKTGFCWIALALAWCLLCANALMYTVPRTWTRLVYWSWNESHIFRVTSAVILRVKNITRDTVVAAFVDFCRREIHVVAEICF